MYVVTNEIYNELNERRKMSCEFAIEYKMDSNKIGERMR
jgi:hypothetical protein